MNAELEQALKINQAAMAHKAAMSSYETTLAEIFGIVRERAIEIERTRSFGFVQRAQLMRAGADTSQARHNSEYAWLDMLADGIEKLAKVYPAARQADNSYNALSSEELQRLHQPLGFLGMEIHKGVKEIIRVLFDSCEQDDARSGIVRVLKIIGRNDLSFEDRVIGLVNENVETARDIRGLAPSRSHSILCRLANFVDMALEVQPEIINNPIVQQLVRTVEHNPQFAGEGVDRLRIRVSQLLGRDASIQITAHHPASTLVVKNF
jgi:hypothetical protein